MNNDLNFSLFLVAWKSVTGTVLQKSFFCVPQKNENPTSSEQHEGELIKTVIWIDEFLF